MSSLAGSAAHLLGRVAQLHGDINARIPGADHHDLLPREGPRALVVPAVQVPALKTLQPCKKANKAVLGAGGLGRGRHLVAGARGTRGVPGKACSGRCASVWCPVHTSTASKTSDCCLPSLSVTTSQRPVVAKSGLLDTRHTLVWAGGSRNQRFAAP